jgi:hypothetical protein
VPHADIVEALVETLSFRHIGVVQEKYAVRGEVDDHDRRENELSVVQGFRL